MALYQIILPMSFRSCSSILWLASLAKEFTDIGELSCHGSGIFHSIEKRLSEWHFFQYEIWQSLQHGRLMGCDVTTDVGYDSLTAVCWQIVYKRTCLDFFLPGVRCCTFSFAASVRGAVPVLASMSFMASCKAHSLSHPHHRPHDSSHSLAMCRI